MIHIWTQGHMQCEDNVAGVAAGHRDPPLTANGRQRASGDIRQRYADQHFDVVFTSDMQRAYDTACLAFEGRGISIVQDARLRECDYGDLAGRPPSEVAARREMGPDAAFPHGESYAQVAERMRSFLAELATERDDQTIMMVGHRATFWMLKHLVENVPLAEALTLDGRVEGVFDYEPPS